MRNDFIIQNDKFAQMRNNLLIIIFVSVIIYLNEVKYMGIGKTLSDILSEQNRNPNELAEKIGESPSTIYSIIRRDNMKVDITVLAKICSELGVDMECFYNEYVKNTPKDTFYLSDHEKALVIAYRKHPDMHNAVDTLLNISSDCSATPAKEA